MKIISTVSLILLLILGFSVAHADPYMDWVHNTSKAQKKYGFPLPKGEIKQLLKDAKPLIKQGIDDPRFYLQLAVYVNTLFGYYYDRVRPLGKYNPNSPESQELVKRYSSYYRKALDANDNPSAPYHFGRSELDAIAHTILLVPDVKERAYRKLINIIQASGDAVPDGYEYTTYQFLLESYSAQKNPDKYLATLNEMIERFGSNEELEGYKRHVEEVIAERDHKTAMHDIYAQADTYTQPKAVVVEKPVKAVEPKQVEVPKATNEAPTSENNTILWWLLGGGALLFGLIVLMRRKQS